MEKIFEVILLLAATGIFVYVLSGASERVSEILNKLLLKITKGKFPKGDYAWMLALIPAFGAVYGLDLDFLNEFKMFQGLDPELVKLLNSIMLWVFSNRQHDQGIGKAIAKK